MSNKVEQNVFETWLRTVCFQKPTPEAYDLAKCAYKFALSQRAPISDVEIIEALQVHGLQTHAEYEDRGIIMNRGTRQVIDAVRALLAAQGGAPAMIICPTYFVHHPDDSYSVADPQPVLAAQGDMSTQSTDGSDVSKNDAGIDISAQDDTPEYNDMTPKQLVKSLEAGNRWKLQDETPDHAPDTGKMIDTIRALTKYNEWRRGGGDLSDHKQIGDAIDYAIAALGKIDGASAMSEDDFTAWHAASLARVLGANNGVEKDVASVIRAERVKGSTMCEWRKNISPALNGSGDVVLCWANEGDLSVSELSAASAKEPQL